MLFCVYIIFILITSEEILYCEKKRLFYVTDSINFLLGIFFTMERI